MLLPLWMTRANVTESATRRLDPSNHAACCNFCEVTGFPKLGREPGVTAAPGRSVVATIL
jgi:hypothetical protein